MSDFPKMYVEGPDDCFSLQALLERNGVRITKEDGPVTIEQTKSVSTLLENLEIYVKTAQGLKQPVAFVLDIDNDLASRWESIRSKLNRQGARLSAADLVTSGLVVNLPRASVGVWLMPDNVISHGKLEDFLRTLIKPNDPCINVALEFVRRISEEVSEGMRFMAKDVEKAEMSAWLSVQNEPGLPYGTAIKARVMEANSPVADMFVKWFKEVYSL